MHSSNPAVRVVFLSILLSMLLSGLSVPALAQEYGIPPTVLRMTDVPDYARLVLNELNRPVLLTLVDGSTLRGTVGGADAAEFTLVLDDRSLMETRVGVSWARISEVRIKRRSRIVEGLFLGAAGGALVGVLSPLGDETRREYLGIEAPQRIWDTAAQGALVGAFIGLLHGIDVVLPHTRQSFGLAGSLIPSRRPARPSMRLINTAPAQSLTYEDIKTSLEDSNSPYGNITDVPVEADKSWNGRTGTALAVETSWQWDPHWWLRSRLEWTTLPRISLETELPPLEVTGHSEILWREYSAWRSMVGLALPFGSVGRLPFAEIAFLAGISRTTLRSHYSVRANPNATPVDVKQSVYRPILMVSGSVAMLRRPKLAVALRVEGVIGPGFTANALSDGFGTEVIPSRRITPIGFSLGIEILLPNF